MGTKAKRSSRSKPHANTEVEAAPPFWALVTGASTGIGYAIAVELLREGCNLVLVSQNKDRLHWAAKNLKRLAKSNIKIVELPADLSTASTPASIYRQVQNKNILIHTLVNNAGVGTSGAFSGQDYKKERNLINVNILALVRLSHLFLPDMLEQGRGRILNVASAAGFLPGPLMANYYASKAFVLHFSEALHRELKDSGICVSALCPGPVDTPFHERSGTNQRRLGQSPLSALISTSPRSAARAACRGMRRQKAVILPGLGNKFSVFMLRFLPRSLVSKIAYFLNGPP